MRDVPETIAICEDMRLGPGEISLGTSLISTVGAGRYLPERFVPGGEGNESTVRDVKSESRSKIDLFFQVGSLVLIQRPRGESGSCTTHSPDWRLWTDINVGTT